ncbi:MAG: tetratricopeptide repeat protein [Pseudomonadales bacterium]|nr:tetratricopeptide repeat protein [Pseudomonadales bacterium]
MADYNEDEQVEALKNWLDENGTSLIIGIVLALAAVFGYQSWEKSVQQTGEAASALYENLSSVAVISPLQTLSDEDKATATFIAEQLKTDYQDTSYAIFAAMHMAKIAVSESDLDKAEAELNWALAQKPEASLVPILNLRLAQIKFAREDYDAALKLLAGNAGEHESSFAELRGDVYYAQGDMTRAREAYQQGLDSLTENFNKPMLKMKLEDLVAPDVSVPAEATQAAASSEGDAG